VDPGDDHVEDLLECEVVADLVGMLGGEEERAASGEYAGAVVVEYGVSPDRSLDVN
jgi:hypothetical protein